MLEIHPVDSKRSISPLWARVNLNLATSSGLSRQVLLANSTWSNLSIFSNLIAFDFCRFCHASGTKKLMSQMRADSF